MRRLTVVAVACLAAVLAVGCSAPDMGVVTGKRFVPDQCVQWNAAGTICELSEYRHWEICIAGGGIQGCRPMWKSELDEYEIGDAYPHSATGS